MSKVVARNRSKSFGVSADSVEQMWAKKRNFGKFRIGGMAANFVLLANEGVLTSVEYAEVKLVIAGLEKLLKYWDKNNEKSKADYLRAIKGGKK